MNAVEIEQAISELAEQTFDRVEFPYQFLIAFGNNDTTVKRLRSGSSNKSDIPNGVLQRTNIHIATCALGAVKTTLQALKNSPATAKAKAKFILATDGEELQAEDLSSGEIVACDYPNFANHFGFFLPLAGISTVKQIRDNPIDIQATSRLNRLYVELLRTNEDWATTERRHDMNQFMGRLIFCYFAEDTNIFNGDDLFTKTVEQMSDSKSNNTDYILKELFRAMDTPIDHRSSLDIPRWADAFPYVNGGLFAGNRDVPKFSRAARSYLLHAGSLNWKEINPDIFGSMIQAVADDEERGALGMHYTSVPNILKVLNPLFLDELREQLNEAGDNGRKLLNLKKRIARMRVFDPACGSGNFLVIAYKELRAIEFKINKLRYETDLKSEIPLSNFRGIEVREFPAEIARLALIIAEFQCDVLYRGQRDALQDFLPLDSKNWIVCGNALRLDWLSICPPTGATVKYAAEDLFHTPLNQHEIDFSNEGGETFICGNPPYKGRNKKGGIEKEDTKHVFSGFSGSFASLDYVTNWLLKACQYSQYSKTAIGLVATNSICQGEQVNLLWPILFEMGIRISSAYTSFKWSNLASDKAGVTVVIIGLDRELGKAQLFENNNSRVVNEIGPYLVPNSKTAVVAINEPLSEQAPLYLGNMAKDGGNLIFSVSDGKDLVANGQIDDKFVRPFYGSEELIHAKPRACLWIDEVNYEDALKSDILRQIFKKVEIFRKSSKAPSTQKWSSKPYRFVQLSAANGNKAIIVPRVSSENRPYLPVDYLPTQPIIGDKCYAMYDQPLWNMALIASRLHWVWIGTVCVRLRTDFSYSNTLGWNTFPRCRW